MKITYKKIYVGFVLLLFGSILKSQNIGVSGAFDPSTVEVCEKSELTIFVSNEDFIYTISAGDAMIEVTFPLSGEYTTPTDPPTGSNPAIFNWTLAGNVWTGMLDGDIDPLNNVDIIFEVTALNITPATDVDLEVILLSTTDLNNVNNFASPSLQIIPNTGTPIDECPVFDQGTFGCLEEIPQPALTVPDFEAQFGNSVLNPGFCEDFDITFSDDTTNMNTGCALDPIILTRTYLFEHAAGTDTCVVQYTIIDDISPVLSCLDITVEMDENGQVTVDPELLSDGVFNSCTGQDDEMITFSLSQSSFDCSDLDPNEMNCASIVGVKLYAEDACGNIDSCDANITIIDNMPPVIDCPSNMTINLESGECSTQHFFTLPSAIDNCETFSPFNGSTTLDQVSGTDLTSGDTFIPGTYSWTYEATDACGNVSQCSFTLEVIEFPIDIYIQSLACNDLINISLNQECMIDLNADMILEGGPYKCYEEYIIEIEGITGTIITSPGSYTVTITDPETGNNCWSNITVEDKLPPVVDCNQPFCETETLIGDWNTQSPSFLPDPSCWDFDSGTPLNNVKYEVIEIIIQVAGNYTFTMTDDINFDGIGAIFSDVFDPTDNCLNLLNGDDDLNGLPDSEPEISIVLSQGTYFLVSTNWNQSYMGDYEWTYTGPSTILAECQYKCFDYSSFKNDEAIIPLPEVSDCSDYNISHSDTFSGDDCFGRTVTRTYIVTDVNGLSSTCSLSFELDPINFEDDIILPQPIVQLNCNQGVEPHAIAEYFDVSSTLDNPSTELVENNEGFEYAYPTYIHNGHHQKIDNSVCSIYAVYNDLMLTSCGEICGGTKKVIRTWTILDWCNSRIENFDQTIKAIDNEAPSLISNDITISTDYWVCEASFEIPAPINLHDNCDLSPEYDVSGPAGITIQGSFVSGFNVIGAPKGDHTFYYNAFDCCGNENSYPFTVFVYDQTPPVVVAKQDIVISLTNGVLDQDGYAKMFAESADNGSHDACSEQLKFEVRRDSDICGVSGNATYNNDGHTFDSNSDSDDGKFVKFCCADISNAVVDVDGDGILDPGYVKVWLRVWDDGDMDGQYGSIGDNFNESWVHVKVEDKLDPIITCPADVTITCDMDIDDLSTTGTATAIGSCGSVEVEYDDIVTNLNSCDQGNIRRRWKVVGKGQIFCDQNITIENQNNATPIVSFAQVGNFTAVGCPDMIAVGEPTWQAGACDMMTYSVDTDTFKFEDGACYKLLREYTVVNWCDYDPTNPQWVETSDFTDGIVRHIQIIKVTDETKPEITMCSDQMFEVNDHADTDNDGNLCEGKITLTNIATDEGSDNCPTGWLKWQVIIDLWSDGIDDWEYNSNLPSFDTNFNDTNGNGIPDIYVSPTFNGEQINIILPDIEGSMSNHKVRWKVSDGCNNITECSYDFMVVDKKAPTPYCINISSAVMESSGTIELWAVDFNLGSFDNCTPNEDLRYTFTDVPPASDNNYDPSRKSSKHVFDCEDVLISPIEVEMYVWDEKGNSDFCFVYLHLTDNNNACGEGMRINGSITSEFGDAASEVEVSINSTIPEYPKTGFTDSEGNYSFSNIPLNVDYQITAKSGDDYLNGVSTLDLVKIQRHILGLEQLDSPYKLIAADINFDYNVKASDLTEMRKLILGVTTEFPNNQSWKFVDASQQLDMDVDLSNISYSRTIHNLQTNLDEVNLVAIKIGDVSENAEFNMKESLHNSETRSSKELNFHFEDKDIMKNEHIEIAFTSDNLKNILGYQFTINLSGLEFSGIEPGIINMSDDFIGEIDETTITVAYNSPTKISANNDEILFTINFLAKKSGIIGDMMSFSSLITSSEAYVMNHNGNIETISIRLNDYHQPDRIDRNYLYQNAPNPFNRSTIINYELKSESPVKFSFFNANGQILKILETQGSKGKNQIIVNANELISKGLVFYKIESGQFIDIKKMIIID